ncbi:unnamed protein product [Trichobilharzia regenti]|nr:unnamed protein product [Trichobilharzia regenti]
MLYSHDVKDKNLFFCVNISLDDMTYPALFFEIFYLNRYGLTSRGLKKLIDGLLYPIKKDLNEGVITTRLAFIHCLLKELACIAMKHSSDTREHAIATDLYRIWESQLTTSTTASYCSTPKEARVSDVE